MSMGSNDKKRLFLLGGNDLEMQTIRKILLAKNEEFLPKNEEYIPWGVTVDKYADVFNNPQYIDYDIYGIELTIPPDWEKPENFYKIDHHGEKEILPSSLEQVAEKIGYELERKELFIAANDKNYIPGMIEAGATMEEVWEIRKEDRKFQGVTDADEENAEESIKQKKHDADVQIIKSSTSKFSPITDRLFPYSKLLIYTDEEIMYYGEGKDTLVSEFQDEINKKSVFHGGGKNGFIGFTHEFLETNKLNESINKIISIVKGAAYSKHLFLFPFTWTIDNIDNKEQNLFSEKTDLSEMYSIFNDDDNWSNMNDSPKEPDEIVKQYNIKAYFYEFARSAIFNKKIDENKKLKFIQKECDILTYNYKLQKDAENTYTIYILPENDIEPKEYRLDIQKISVSFYSSGIGIFSISLLNYDHPSFQEILTINDYGRRVYPQFLDTQTYTIGTKNSFLADSISIKYTPENGTTPCEIKEVFEDYIPNGKPIEIKLPSFIKEFLPGSTSDKEAKVRYTPNSIIDDRMFTVCLYLNDELAHTFSKQNQLRIEKQFEYNYENNSDWYRYIFLDTSEPTCKNKKMMNELLQQATYARWVEQNGLLYGITRYSFMGLTTENWFSRNILWNHFETMYYEMVKLCLAQKASILRYNNEITDIITFPDKDSDKVKKAERISDLSGKYFRFSNKLFFTEVTAQDQGIELYTKIQSQLGIPNEIKQLNRRIDEMFQYVNMLADKLENKKLKNISIWGAALLIPSLILAWAQVMCEEKSWCICNDGWLLGGICVGVGVGVYFLMK
ncbi:MAG: hypothetical protein R6U95_04710, partial [Bacteroidales bacterium]